MNGGDEAGDHRAEPIEDGENSLFFDPSHSRSLVEVEESGKKQQQSV